MAFEEEFKDRKTPEAIAKDEKAERILKQLGFKPGQIISSPELIEKIRTTFPSTDDKPYGVETFADNELIESHILQLYFRFISKEELKELKEIQGRL